MVQRNLYQPAHSSKRSLLFWCRPVLFVSGRFFWPFFNKTLHGKKYAKNCKNRGPPLNRHRHRHRHRHHHRCHHYRCHYRYYYYFFRSLRSQASIRHMVLESTFTPIFLVLELFLLQRALLVRKKLEMTKYSTKYIFHQNQLPEPTGISSFVSPGSFIELTKFISLSACGALSVSLL